MERQGDSNNDGVSKLIKLIANKKKGILTEMRANIKNNTINQSNQQIFNPYTN